MTELTIFAPVFVLVAARVLGMVLAAPIFGSGMIPWQVRILLALVLALGIFPAVAPPAHLPATTAQAVAAIAGEAFVGVAIGLSMRLVFVGVQWAGELVGQQMGLNLAGVFDPNWGEESSMLGGIYMLLATVVFLIAGGHRALLGGVRVSFDAVPVMTAGFDRSLLDMVLAVFQAATGMAIRLAAPMLVTLLIVDLVIAFVGRTVPQLMTFGAGVSVRPIMGLAVLSIGIAMSANVIVAAIKQSMWIAEHSWVRAIGP